jgi:ParB-like chromosome segregation protein Spo0J
MEQVQFVPIATIKVGERYRKHMGDLQALADSIDKDGLLHPLVINQEKRLDRWRAPAASLPRHSRLEGSPLPSP